MKIQVTKKFKKALKKLPVHIKKISQQRIKEFSKNPKSPALKDHELKGKMKGLRSFSITGDYRIIYEKCENGEVIFIFVNIGTHSKVYK